MTDRRLVEGDLGPDPLKAFAAWFDAARAAGDPEPDAMVLATADATGAPSARNVLLKSVDSGFVFHTNRTSRKGSELAENPRAALVFRWYALQRQVVVNGAVEVLDDAASDAYFATRSRGSQLAAWASRQSQVIAGRETVEAWLASAGERFDGRDVSRPPFWGGYRVVPATIEFWQAGVDRVHDRLRYRRTGDGWVVERLSP